jgi:hypothetical protein
VPAQDLDQQRAVVAADVDDRPNGREVIRNGDAWRVGRRAFTHRCIQDRRSIVVVSFALTALVAGSAQALKRGLKDFPTWSFVGRPFIPTDPN